MFSIDLWNLFAPLLAGSLALFGCSLIYWSCVRAVEPAFLQWFMAGLWELMRPPPDKRGEDVKSDSLHTLLLFPLLACAIFGLGVVLDSAVDDFVDGEPTAAAPIRWIAAAGLPRENDLRFSAMFDRSYPKKRPWWSEARELVPLNFNSVAYSCEKMWPDVERGRAWIKLSGLSNELLWAREGYAHFLDLTEVDGLPKTEFEKRRSLARQTFWCPQSLLLADRNDETSREARHSCPRLGDTVKFTSARNKDEWDDRCDLAMHIARKYYYDASNYARRNAQLSSELNRWQAQRGLLGATHLVCMIVALVLAVRLIATPSDWQRRRSAKVWLWMALLGAWFSAYGFTISSRNYIERTLGTYASALHHDNALVVRAGERAMRAECERLVERSGAKFEPASGKFAGVDDYLWSMTCRDVLTKPAKSADTAVTS